MIDTALLAQWLREDAQSLVRMAQWVQRSYTDATVLSEEAIDSLALAQKIIETFGGTP